ncbi:MAG: radical SAM family heme chaperone HemW [Oscillospiraceae bacterium]
MIGIYIHVPFCARKCPYCDFYSEGYSKDKILSYGKAIVRNLEYYSKYKAQADTLYFGGGTPSLMDTTSIEETVKTAKKLYNMPTDSEITLEVNPRTLSIKKLENLRKVGINRLSIGVQSCIDSELKTLGRNHTFKDCQDLVDNAHLVGFKNISCDLMVGTPSQTMDSLKYSCETLSKLDIKHISSYMLKIEENTPFNDKSILEKLPDDDIVSEMYLKSVEIFKSYGLNQYEISNFAKIGFESRHNLKYWQCVDYLGIGSASHSCFDGKRFCVPSDRDDFITREHQNIEVTEENPYSFEEIGMLSLRLVSGLDLSKFPKVKDTVIKKAIPLQKMGYLTINKDNISLTPKGFLVSNTIIENLILD